MNTLTAEIWDARVQQVVVTEDTLTAELADGRTVSVPLAWYPRLLDGTHEERRHWRLIGRGEGIHWPDLDEDISVGNLLLGKPSGESQASFRRWIEARRSRAKKSKLAPVSASKKSPRPSQKGRRRSAHPSL